MEKKLLSIQTELSDEKISDMLSAMVSFTVWHATRELIKIKSIEASTKDIKILLLIRQDKEFIEKVLQKLASVFSNEGIQDDKKDSTVN